MLILSCYNCKLRILILKTKLICDSVFLLPPGCGNLPEFFAPCPQVFDKVWLSIGTGHSPLENVENLDSQKHVFLASVNECQHF